MFSKRRSRAAEPSTEGKQASAAPVDRLVAQPQTKPSLFDLSEWSLRRKVALVLAVPVLLAGTFGGLRVRAERAQADNYAATATQVSVLGPAIEYLAAAEHAAIVARAVGINDPKLDEAQQEVVAAGARLVDARDKADLTPKQLAQVNNVLTLSEQMRTGMAYVSVASSVSQVRQLERGVTQVISTIVDEQIKPEDRLLVLAQALDGRLSLALQQIQVSGTTTTSTPPSCTPSSAWSWRPSTVSRSRSGRPTRWCSRSGVRTPSASSTRVPATPRSPATTFMSPTTPSSTSS